MIDIFLKKKNDFNQKPLTVQYKKNETEKNHSKDEYKNLVFYPSSSKEWSSSIFTYNKSYLQSIASNDIVVNKLFKSYFNMLQYKIKVFFKRRRDNKSRYSANKLYISKSELKHTNSKLIIILYTYNKQKVFIERYTLKLISLVKKIKIRIMNRKFIFYVHIKKTVVSLKNKFFFFKKWKMASFKIVQNLLDYLILIIRKRWLYRMPAYNNLFLKKQFKLRKTVFNYIRLINFNKSKFSNLVLAQENFGLFSLLQKIYGKKVEIKLVELRSIHLNSDVFSTAIALKLRDRKNKAVRVLRKAILNMVRIPDLHTLITFDDRTESMNKNNVLSTIKQQVVSGVRFEATGRLTRRLTAMRSIFKYRYVGSLKNIRSSLNNKSSTILRGHVKSNSEFTMINSKTRNGAFGLKGWVSSH